jgi:iron complex outermembrane recepter protein
MNYLSGLYPRICHTARATWSGGPLFRLLCNSFVITLALASVVPGRAQPSGTGSVEGRVQNAATGTYLANARVSVKGSNLVTFTDEGGSYRLDGVPTGAATLRVFFTGLDEQELAVTVSPGQTAQADLKLTNQSRYDRDTEAVKLDSFVVQSTKETNAAAIAVNEQRFAANIKSVVSTDEFGTIPDTNPGEFMKWLPGVGVEYFANNIVGVNVRGLGSANTEINFDGMPIASAATESTGRAFEMKGGSSADIARVEIRKLPLPEDSSNALGGSINLVRRSAFEFSKRQISYRLLFTSDGEKLTLAERDGPKDRKMDRWRPNWELKWTEPLSKTMGFAVTIGQNDAIVMTHWSLPSWGYGSAAQAAAAEAAIAAGRALNTVSIYNPANVNQLLHDAPIKDSRDYASFRFDWKPVRDLKLGYSVGGTNYRNQTADDIRYRWRSDQTGSGDPRFVDERTTLGRAGGGGIYHDTPLWRDQYNPTLTSSVEATWRRDAWTIFGRGVWSQSRHKFYDTEHGFFNSTSATGLSQTGIGASTANPISLITNFYDQTYFGPRRIEALTTATGAGSTNAGDYNVPVEWWKNANINIGGARSRPGGAKEIVTAAKLFVKRDFRFENPLSLQLGFDYNERFRNRYYVTDIWRFVGADHRVSSVANPSTDDRATLIAADNLPPHRDAIFDLPPIERISLSKLYKLYQDHPDWFEYLPNESFRGTVNQPFEIKETTTAPYLQFDWLGLKNRLRLTGGVRYEKTDAEGRGFFQDQSAAYQKYSDGTVRRANDVVGASGLPTSRGGAPVYLPGVTSGSLAEAQLTMKAKGARGEGSIDNYFPSLHGTYNFTDQLQLQFGYAKTQAKNRFDRTVIPSTTVNDTPQSDGALGVINIRNPELQPWVGQNYEARISYYTRSGGTIGIGGFRKNIHNWQVGDIELLTDLAAAQQWGFGQEYVGYNISTMTNAGNARIDGAELEVRQALDKIVPWRFSEYLRGFMVTGSMNYTDLKGQPGGGDFGSLNERRDTVHLRYSSRKFSAGVGYIMNGRIVNQTDTAAGREGIRVTVPQHMLDFNADYAVTKYARLFVSGRNISKELRRRERQFAEAPTWSNLNSTNNLGVTYTIGVTGTF